MTKDITKKIRISIKVKYASIIYNADNLNYLFRYFITIVNDSSDTVQLLERYWKLYDSQNKNQVHQGSGVIGLQPILKPNETFSYSSSCYISSPIGAIKGNYKMIFKSTNQEFTVGIPTSQLSTTIALN